MSFINCLRVTASERIPAAERVALCCIHKKYKILQTRLWIYLGDIFFIEQARMCPCLPLRKLATEVFRLFMGKGTPWQEHC